MMTRAVLSLFLVVAALAARLHAQGDPDWVPPVGCPIPFGIVEDIEDFYGAGSGATYDYSDDGGTGAVAYRTAGGYPYTYYVDKTHINATDNSNPHGSPTTPRLTWPYPLVAGDCVQVRGGAAAAYAFTNSGGGKMAIGGAGTAEAPIFFYGVEALEANMPTLSGPTGHECMIYGNYTIIERIKGVDDLRLMARGPLKGAPIHHVMVRHSFFRGTGIEGNPTVFSSGGSSATAENYTDNLWMWNCVMSDYGDWESPNQNDSCGAILAQHCTNSGVVDCEIYQFGGDGFRIGADQGDTPSGGWYYIGRNTVYRNRENALDVKQARNAVISENHFHTFTDSSTSGGTVLAIHYNPQNIWIINNRIHNGNRGIASTTYLGGHCWIIGNWLDDHAEYAMYPDRGGGTFHIFQNTITNSAYGIRSTGTIDALDLGNNLLYAIANTYTQLSNSTARAASLVRNELYYESPGAISVVWSTTYTTMAAWDSAHANVSGLREVNPLFTNAGALDFTLQAGSQAMDNGIDWTTTVYSVSFTEPDGDVVSLSGTIPQLFEAMFPGRDFPETDLNGVYRNQGDGFDIGAYERDEGETPPADVTAPTPDPLTFSSAPAATGTGSIAMTANTATDATGPVEYYFDETSGNAGGSDSGWQSSTSYTDTGLSPSTQYTYRVRARDAVAPTPNETAYSSPANATTDDEPAAPSELTVEATTANVGTITIAP